MTKTGGRLVRVVVLSALVGGLTSTGSAARALDGDPSVSDWARLRACESSGRYDVVAVHGHYGAYQFDIPTWQSVGGSGLPSDATPAEQDYRALRLYRMRGWQPWECARIVGLVPGSGAGSGRVPDRAEAAYIGSPGAPEWPGRVYDLGDCDPALRAWQLRMNVAGYDFRGTGCYGEKTRRAVLAVQRANGIPDTGRLGPRTWRAAWTGQPVLSVPVSTDGVQAAATTEGHLI